MDIRFTQPLEKLHLNDLHGKDFSSLKFGIIYTLKRCGVRLSVGVGRYFLLVLWSLLFLQLEELRKERF